MAKKIKFKQIVEEVGVAPDFSNQYWASKNDKQKTEFIARSVVANMNITIFTCFFVSFIATTILFTIMDGISAMIFGLFALICSGIIMRVNARKFDKFFGVSKK